MLSHAWAFLWAFPRGLFHVWVYFVTHGLAVSRMLSDAWAFPRMGLFGHAWIGSLTYAFSVWVHFFTHGLALSRMLPHAWAFSRIGLLSHAWIGSLTYAFSRMGFLSYGSTLSPMDWLSHVCFLTHGLVHVLVYFFTHGLDLSRMLSHAWAFSRMGTFSRMD